MSTTTSVVLNHLDSLAVLTGGVFASTAFYITVSVIPALRAFGLDEHWRFFPFFFEKTAPVQGLCTLTAGLAGVFHGTRIIGSPFYRNLWIAAGSVFLVIIPFTHGIIVPINKTIINDNKKIQSGKESQVNVVTRKKLLDQWTALHLIRTVGAGASFCAMIFGLSRHTSLVLG